MISFAEKLEKHKRLSSNILINHVSMNMLLNGGTTGKFFAGDMKAYVTGRWNTICHFV